MSRSAVIFGVSGPELTAAERAFFAGMRPWGFILFARNLRDRQQITDLTAELRALGGGGPVPVLIDQEGGRVARLRPPLGRLPPAAARLGALHASAPEGGIEATYLNSRVLAADLRALGITVNCTPCIDLPVEGAHDIIGDRAYGRDPHVVTVLGRAVVDGLRDGGVAPIIKHIPGHGRATADSHEALPVVTTSRSDLSRTDFVPFRGLNDIPMAMTAHVVYADIDPDLPATLSPRVVGEVIRGEIGFDGLLMTDDLSMQALTGSFEDRTRASYSAGCDVILHCNGNLAEMEVIARALRPLEGEAARRAAAATQDIRTAPPAFDRDAALARFDLLLASMSA